MIEEYEDTARMIDDTPRPRASQDVAARKRGRNVEEAPSVSLPKQHQHLIVGIVGICAIIGVFALAIGQRPATPLQLPATIAPTEAPSVPTDAPAPTIAPDTHVASAYAAPDGVVLGPVDLAGELVIAVGRAGSAWVQIERGDRSRVWFRRADLPGNLAVPESLPDLTTQPTPTVSLPPQIGRGLTTSQDDTGEQPTPEPATETWPTSAPVLASDFKKPDIKDRCLLIGCLGQQAVDLSRAQACHALFWQYGGVDAETIAEPDYSAVRACIWEGLYR